MIPIEKLRQVTVVYTHAKCPDGMASAMILKDAFRMLGMNPPIEFLVHDTEEHEKAGREVREGELALFCDISPSSKGGFPLNTAFWAANGEHAIVLDHHKGTREIVEAFGENGVYADAETEPGVSGAMLAFREVWAPIFELKWDVAKVGEATRAPALVIRRAVEYFAECSGIRDCYVTSDLRFIRGQHIAKMLMSKPSTYWLEPRDVMLEGPVGWGKEAGPLPCLTNQEISNGAALFEMHLEAVRQAVDQCVIYDIAEKVVLYVFQEQACGFRLTSDVAEATRVRLKEQGSDHPGIVAGFSYVLDKPGSSPKLSWSLRGLNGFDVQKFAEENGGNGHAAAAGFATKIEGGFRVTPYREICNRLAAHLKVDA